MELLFLRVGTDNGDNVTGEIVGVEICSDTIASSLYIDTAIAVVDELLVVDCQSIEHGLEETNRLCMRLEVNGLPTTLHTESIRPEDIRRIKMQACNGLELVEKRLGCTCSHD